MSYTPNEWKKGDVVTSEKLNHMEQGIAESGGGGWDACIEFDFFTDPENPTAQFTFGSRDVLMEKVNAGIVPMVCFKNGTVLVSNVYTVEKDWDDPNVLVMNVGSVDDYTQCSIKADGSIDVS